MIPIGPQDRVFILTGSGVSAESGIPTFRGVHGLWRNYRIEEVASPHAWERDPTLVWDFYSMRRRVAAAAKPNPAHLALADLESKLADRLFLCTQNVDNLHEQAGSSRVRHMHGELFKSRCDTCRRPPFPDDSSYEAPVEIPRCECGGRIRPHICWFGEVPFEMDLVLHQLGEATLVLVAGSSGVVEPAASFVRMARHNRARSIYVGPEEPANRAFFDEVLLGKAGDVLPQLVQDLVSE